MPRKLLVFGILLLLSACSGSEQMSWHERKIEELHYSKKLGPMKMATQMKNQTICEEYGKANWGEMQTFGDWFEYQEFKFSPLYDQCFVKRTSDNYKENIHLIIIFDVLSEGRLVSYSSDCRENHSKSILYSFQDMEDLCPSEDNVNRVWMSLLGE